MDDTELERFLSAVREGLADAEAGRVIDDEELDSFLDEQFGPLTEAVYPENPPTPGGISGFPGGKPRRLDRKPRPLERKP